MPFSFLFLSRVLRRGKTSDVIGLLIAYAVLILTHLPLTVIGSICLGIYGLTLLRKESFIPQITKSGVAVLGALGASSFFWTKVLLEKDLMAKTLIYEDPWLDYKLHFLLTPIQTFVGELRERIYETATFYYDLMFLCAVVLALSCTIPFLVGDKKSKFSMKGVWLLFGVSVFLIIPFSKPIWDVLPFLQEVQFPWRWIAVVCIFGSILAASQLDLLLDWFRNTKRPFALIIAGCILGVFTFSFSQIVRQAPHIPAETTEDYIQKSTQDIGFTFWWTIWTRKPAFDNKEKVTVENRNVQINNWTATDREFQISEGSPGEARIATFYHPNWKANVNGGDVEIKRDENGAILIPLPKEKSNVKLTFVEPQSVQVGGWIALSVWLSLLLFGFGKLLKSIKLKPKNEKPSVDFWQTLNKIYELTAIKGRIFLLLPVALLTLLPMILFGIFNGGDLYQHLQFAGTFEHAIADGNFYPSWGGFENNGYGSNGVRFYPPAMSFVLGLMKFLAGNWQIATILVFLFFTFIGGVGVYLWAKEYLPSEKAIWAGIIFILMPYHLIEIHNASMYAEFAGVSVISFSFLFLTRVCNRGKWADVLGLAVAYSALILTHLPSTVIGSLSLFVYGILIIPKEKIFSTISKLGIAVGLGLCASAIYWSRMVFERDWMRNTKFWKDDHFDYNINFLLTSPWVDNRQLWFFNLVLLSLAIFVAGCVVAIYFKSRQTDKHKLLGLIVLFGMSIMMTTIISKPFWAFIPYLHEVQFPWRWLTIACVSGPVLIAIGIESLRRLAKESDVLANKVKIFLLAVMFLFSVLFGLIWIGFQLNHIPSGNYDEWATEQAQGMGAEWFWTPQMNEDSFKITERLIANGRNPNVKLWKPEERNFTIEDGEPTNVRVATIYYPYWKATVNGKAAEVKLADDGAILIPIGTEKSEVRLWFEEPARVQNAAVLSKVTWLVFFVLGLFCGISFLRNSRTKTTFQTL